MRPDVPSISIGAITKLFSTIREHGIDPDLVCADVGFDKSLCNDADNRVPLETLHSLWERAAARGPLAGAAVVGAQRYTPGDYGLMGFVAMNSGTLVEAFSHVVRFMALWTDEPGMRLNDNGALEVIYRTRFADRLGLRYATEATLAEVLHGARMVTQSALAPQFVTFTHAAPQDTAVYEEFFGSPVRFEQPTAAMQFTQEQLRLTLPKADAQLGAFLRSMASEALARQKGTPESPLDHIRTLIAEELQKGVPTLEQVAKRMATSERTLRRRLEQEGSTFRELLDSTRAQLARSYVRDRRLPLSEVAFLLGFSEPSAFHRAFKRWTDSTPSAFRQRVV